MAEPGSALLEMQEMGMEDASDLTDALAAAQDSGGDGGDAGEQPPDPVAELRAQFDAFKAEAQAREAELQAKAQEPELEQARQAFAAELQTMEQDFRALALPEAEIQQRIGTYAAGKQFLQQQPALTQMAIKAYAFDLAERMLPDNATKAEILEFRAHISAPEYAGNVKFMETAGEQWLAGRQYRTQQQQASNREQRQMSGAERTEGVGRNYTAGRSDDDLVRALGKGERLSSDEMARATAAFRRQMGM